MGELVRILVVSVVFEAGNTPESHFNAGVVTPDDPTRIEEDSSGAAGTARGRTPTPVLV